LNDLFLIEAAALKDNQVCMTDTIQRNVALYACNDWTGLDDTEVQLEVLRQYCAGKRWHIAACYTERLAAPEARRTILQTLIADARAAPPPFDTVLVTDVSRLVRTPQRPRPMFLVQDPSPLTRILRDVLTIRETLDQADVALISLGLAITDEVQIEMDYQIFARLPGRGLPSA
jgi:DNA invertase Pin-like site-specific DNA recombinase